MQSVFEVLGNFPTYDVLRATTHASRFVRSAAFRRLYEDASMPQLGNDAVEDRLRSLPPGSVGREYAEFMRGWGLDNSFLNYVEVDDIAAYFAYRYGHCHDLFHFVLGYPPFQDSAEMEIEAFLFAQTGGLNHLLFVLGFARRLARQDPRKLRRIVPRLRVAYERGRRSGNVMLLRWEDVLARPLDEVRAELGVDDRPVLARERVRVQPPTEVPKLAHVVLNSADPEGALDWYRDVFGLEMTARDDRLGAVFLSDGTDHHTLALARSWGRGVRGIVRGIHGDLRALAAMVSARGDTAAVADRRRLARPTMRLVREHMRPGVQHIGYRVSSDEELRAWFQHLRANGVDVDWMVNHGDMISGIYFLDPTGVRLEIFCDGPRARAKLAALADGADRAGLVETDFHNWVLDLEEP